MESFSTKSAQSGHSAVAKRVDQQSESWCVLTEVIEAEAELKALQRHALELVDPEV
jgi:hypothetical protein